MQHALDGVRVLDLTHYVAGPFCTKLLADYGADVLKVERPPAGDPARSIGPFCKDLPHLEGSALFLHLNTNKRSVTLNLKSSEGREIVGRLVRDVDLVVENFRPGVLDRLGLGYESLRAINPRIILTSISNFGQRGPYRDLRGSEITLYAMGGAMNATGHQSREPLKLGGNVVQYHAGAVAAYASMLALWRAEQEGEGDHVDVSIYETQTGSRDRQTIHLTNYAYHGHVARRAETETRLAAGIRPAADGYIYIAGYGRRLPSFLRMIGREDLADDPRAHDSQAATDPEWVDEIETRFLEWLADKPKAEVLALAQEHHLVAGVVNTIADLFTDPHFRERSPWDVVDHPHTGPLTLPGRPFVMSATPRRDGGRAPLLGEHNEQVLCGDLGYGQEDLRRLRELGVI